MIGLFAIVQGFEAARYIGVRCGAEERIRTMRAAQGISTIVFVVFLLALLSVLLPATGEADNTAIFLASDQVGDLMPWLLLLAALGSQTSAIISASAPYFLRIWTSFLVISDIAWSQLMRSHLPSPRSPPRFIG